MRSLKAFRPKKYQEALWQINNGMGFATGTIAADQNEEVHAYLEQHPEYRNDLFDGADIHINTDADRYVENVQSYLRLGALITADMMTDNPQQVNSLVGMHGNQGWALRSMTGSDFGQSLVYLGINNGPFGKMFSGKREQFHQGMLWNFYEGDREVAVNVLTAKIKKYIRSDLRDDISETVRRDMVHKMDGQNNYYVFAACVGSGWQGEACFTKPTGPYAWSEEAGQ